MAHWKSFILLAALSCFVVGQTLAMGDADAYPITETDRKFVAEVVDAVKRNDVVWLADHAAYPLSITSGKHPRVAADKKQFIPVLRKQLTEAVRASITEEARKPLFKNWQGVMIGNGILWFTEFGTQDQSTWMMIMAIGGFTWQPNEIEIEAGPPSKGVEPPKLAPGGIAKIESWPLATAKMILYSLDPNDHRLHGVNKEHSFHPFTILGEAEITKQSEKAALIKSLVQGLREGGAPADCFNPRHGLRVIVGSSTNDFVICFECGWVKTFGFSQNDGGSVSRSPLGVFDEAVNRHHLKKPKER